MTLLLLDVFLFYIFLFLYGVSVILSGSKIWSINLAVAGMAYCCSFYFGRIVHTVFTLFQDLGSQVQQHSFKPEEITSFTLRS